MKGGFVEFGLALKLWRVIEGFSAEEDRNPIFGVERSLWQHCEHGMGGW